MSHAGERNADHLGERRMVFDDEHSAHLDELTPAPRIRPAGLPGFEARVKLSHPVCVNYASDPSMAASRFRIEFERWARRVRRRLLARGVLAGLGIGLGVGAAVTGLLFFMRQGELRPFALALGALGALGGALFAFRRRFSDGDVALYLDARLDSREAIATAVELERAAPDVDQPARELVLSDAALALEQGDPKLARPHVLRAWHSIAPLGAGAVVWLSLLPLPAAPSGPPAAPGAETVQLSRVEGLDPIVALEKLAARDPAQQERLKRIAEEAKKLRAELAKGIEKRDAQAKVAKLRDEIAAERLSLGNDKNRAGLEAALAKLRAAPQTKDAAKALGNGDLVEFDREMQKLASKVEQEHRDSAKKALEEAAKAARERGAEDVARTLEEEQKLFKKREAGAQALRELGEALKGKLSEQAQKDLEEFGQSGSPEAQKRLSEALSDALGKLSDEEKKKLAEKLKQGLERQEGASPLSKEQIEELARKLSSPEGKKELEEQLKELAKQDPSSEAERQKKLDEADRGGAQAQRNLGALPIPTESPGGSGKGGDKKGPSGKQNGSGGPGSKKDEGQGSHEGSTNPVPGNELRAKADPRLLPGAPLQGSSLGRAPGRAGETANQRGTGVLGKVGPTEVGGVERSEVPEEYREQVGRYFQP